MGIAMSSIISDSQLNNVLERVQALHNQHPDAVCYAEAVVDKMRKSSGDYRKSDQHAFLLFFTAESFDRTVSDLSDIRRASISSIDVAFRRLMRGLPEVTANPPYQFLKARPDIFYKNGIFPLPNVQKEKWFIADFKNDVPDCRLDLMNEILGQCAVRPIKGEKKKMKRRLGEVLFAALLEKTPRLDAYLEKLHARTVLYTPSDRKDIFEHTDVSTYYLEENLRKVAKDSGYSNQDDINAMISIFPDVIQKLGLSSALKKPSSKKIRLPAARPKKKKDGLQEKSMLVAAVNQEKGTEKLVTSIFSADFKKAVLNRLEKLEKNKGVKSKSARLFRKIFEKVAQGIQTDEAIGKVLEENESFKISIRDAKIRYAAVKNKLKEFGIIFPKAP